MVVCLNIKWKLWNLQHLTLWSPSYQNSVTAGNKDPDQISERRKVNRERIYPTATFLSSTGGQRFHQLYSSLKRWLLWLDKGVKYLSWSEINPNLWQPGFFSYGWPLKKIYRKAVTWSSCRSRDAWVLTIGFLWSFGLMQRTKKGWQDDKVLISRSRDFLNWAPRVGERFLVSSP